MNIDKKNRADLRQYFATNATPTAANFADLIGAALNQKDDGIAKPDGDPLSIEATSNEGKPLLNLYESFAETPAWVLRLAPTGAKGLTISDNAKNNYLFIRAQAGGQTAGVGISTVNPTATLDVAGSFKAQTATVSGALTAATLTVSGAQSAGSLSVSGALSVGTNVSIGATLTVKTTATISGAFTASSTATISGAFTANSTATISGALTVSSTATISGALTAGSATVSGNASVNGALSAGSATVLGAASVNGALSAGSATVSGTATLGTLAFSSGGVSASKIVSAIATDTSAASSLPTCKAINDLLPIGAIIMWSGSFDKIPVNWKLCDGQNGTPDLRGRFVLGATQSEANSSANRTGGSATVTLSEENLPSHGHTITISEAGSHSHSLHGYKADFDHEGDATEASLKNDGDGDYWVDTEGAGSHSHPASASKTGGGKAFDIKPPYYKLAYIMRVS